MTKNSKKKLPEFQSLDKLVEFFDSHDLGDYLEQMPEVHFEVAIKRKPHLFVLDDKLAKELTKIARAKQISSEALINDWLKEKIEEQ
ncbi:MAG: CopG family antitoxin [bacterium]